MSPRFAERFDAAAAEQAAATAEQVAATAEQVAATAAEQARIRAEMLAAAARDRAAREAAEVAQRAREVRAAAAAALWEPPAVGRVRARAQSMWCPTRAAVQERAAKLLSEAKDEADGRRECPQCHTAFYKNEKCSYVVCKVRAHAAQPARGARAAMIECGLACFVLMCGCVCVCVCVCVVRENLCLWMAVMGVVCTCVS